MRKLLSTFLFMMISLSSGSVSAQAECKYPCPSRSSPNLCCPSEYPVCSNGICCGPTTTCCNGVCCNKKCREDGTCHWEDLARSKTHAIQAIKSTPEQKE